VAAAIDGGGDGGGGGDEAFAPRSTAAHVLLECSACRQFPCPVLAIISRRVRAQA
jgi:hypothetical protein